MTKDKLQKLFEQYQCRELSWKGKCHDCKKQIEVVARVEDDGDLKIWGGAVYETEQGTFVKCDDCFSQNNAVTEFNPCEIYSRIVGYLRPVQQWNPGKQAEVAERKDFKMKGSN